ncbi:hypothetical protein Tco_1194796 [Tanacetum coccineum]
MITEIPQSSEPTNLDADEAIHKESGDSVERAATTAATLDAGQDSGGSPRYQEAIRDTIAQTRSERVSTPSYDSPLLEVNTPGNDEERIKLKELMDMCTKLSDRVLDLDNVKDAQALEIKKLKKRVKELERRNKSRTSQPKKELIIDKKEPTELVEDKGSDEKVVGVAEDKDSTTDPVTTASKTITTAVDVSVGSPTRLVDDTTTDDVTLAETLMAIRRSASRPQKLKGVRVVFKELKWDSIKARIYADAQLAERLQEEEREHMSVEEQARLLMELIATRKKLFTAKRAEEQRNKPPTKGKSFDAIKKMFDKAYKHVNDFVPMDTKSSGKKLPDENQILLKIPRKDNMYSFDMKNIVPKESLTCLEDDPNIGRNEIEQGEGISCFNRGCRDSGGELDEEARLEREREEEASKAANIAKWDDVQAMMDADYEKKHFSKLRADEQRRKPPTKTQKRIIMSTYLKNMAGYKHTQLKNKIFEEIQMLFEKEIQRVNIFVDMDAEQKVDDDDKEREDLKQCFEIVPGEEFVFHVIPLAVKPAPILVKTKHGYTRPEEAYERVLWGDLKVMFEPDVEDNIWRNLQGQKILL